MLRKKQWSVKGHEARVERTIEAILELALDKTKKGADRLGVKCKPYWDFIPVRNYTIPLLHILIGVFNDVDDYLIDLVDSHIIPVKAAEQKIRDDIKGMDDKIQPLMQTVNAWKQTAEGKERSKLLTRKNKMDDRMKAGQPVGNAYLTVEEVERYQHLDNVFSQMCKTRDDLKAEKRKMKDKLDAYRRERKLDPKSVHNKIERLASSNGLDRGAAFGGKYNGKVARKVMENPEPIYDGIRDILLANKAPHITIEYITTLCMKVVDVMRSWNKFFSLLQQKAPTEADRAIADEIAQTAVSKHVDLVKNATPKVHIAGVHAVDQYLRVRPGLVRLLIEH